MPSDRPNIVLIFTDQMRGDCLGIDGHGVVRTPHLDRLAGGGIRFSRAYSPCPSCIAARASLFTGLSPSSTGRLGYRDAVPWRYPNMLTELLSRAGYQTHCVGKTHFFPQRAHLGFETLESYEGGQNFDGLYVNDYYEWLKEKSGGRFQDDCGHGLSWNSWLARPSNLPEEFHNNTWVATRSLEFLKRRDRGRPFFLFASFHRPHAPIDPPAEYWRMYQGFSIPPPPVGDWASVHDVPVTSIDAWQGRLADDVLADSRRGYYAQISHIDSQVGRLMHGLDELGGRPTIIIFASDHGEMLGDHCLFRKTYAYEGSARVALIVSPGDTGEMVCDAPVVLHDLYPTILQSAGVAIPRRTEGLSLWDIAKNDGTRASHPFVHGEHSSCYHPSNAMQFLTDGRWKYIWFTAEGNEQLFDLQADPQELHDLSGQAGSKDQLLTWRRRLIKLLAGRPEDGLSDGNKLITGLLGAIRRSTLDKWAGEPMA